MYTFIFDIGKTNIKGHVLDQEGAPVWSRSCSNEPDRSEPYWHFDIDRTWSWLLDVLREAAASYPLSAINVSTHGACAVLLDNDDSLALPVLDYEFDELSIAGLEYQQIRPPFEKTHSPALGAGLNLGKQLWWLKNRFPQQFQTVDKVLMYPQYWVYKLTGIAVTELTSVGCHTDLWEPQGACYSSLVSELGIEQALPPIVRATESIGGVLPQLAAELGLPASCEVFAGVHDSNAGFARYLSVFPDAQFTAVSTGTWVVTMSGSADLNALREEADTLTNISVTGMPLPCARFMGGREYEEICRLTGASAEAQYTLGDIQQIVNSEAMALPPFAKGSGPFARGGRSGELVGKADSGVALASLYLALMIDYELSLLKAQGRVLLGGIARKNPILCQLLAQLRPDQHFYAANDKASTILGAWCLTRWGQPLPASFSDFSRAQAATIEGLVEYRDAWRARAEKPL